MASLGGRLAQGRYSLSDQNKWKMLGKFRIVTVAHSNEMQYQKLVGFLKKRAVKVKNAFSFAFFECANCYFIFTFN